MKDSSISFFPSPGVLEEEEEVAVVVVKHRRKRWVVARTFRMRALVAKLRDVGDKVDNVISLGVRLRKKDGILSPTAEAVLLLLESKQERLLTASSFFLLRIVRRVVHFFEKSAGHARS